MNLPDSKNTCYEEGLKQYNNGNLAKAISHYRKSIDLAYLEKAVDQLFIFEKSIELAQICLEANLFHDVLQFVNQAFGIYNNNKPRIITSKESADFLELLGNLTFYLEHFNKAAICYSDAESLYLDLNNKNLAKAKKSMAQARLGNISTAIKELQSVITLEGLNIETKNKARKYLADIMVLTSQYQEALNCYQMIFSELEQKYEITTYWLLETLFNMATANFELGNYGISLNQYKQLVTGLDQNKFPGSVRLKIQTFLMIAKISIIIMDTPEAVRLLDSVDEQSLPDNDKLYYQLIRAQIELEDLNSEQAGNHKYIDLISGCKIGEISNDKDAEILTLQSSIHLRDGEILSATNILNKLISYYQSTHDVYQVIIYKLKLCHLLLLTGTDYHKAVILSHIIDVELLISNEEAEVFVVMTQIQISKLYCRLQEYSQAYKTLHLIYLQQWHLVRKYAM
jgi:tetratricopeptide (TPR) repeat protein